MIIKLIIDANIILSALIKPSITRKIIFENYHTLFAPEFIIEEVKKYRSMVIKRAGLTQESFDKLYELIFNEIELIPNHLIRTCIDESMELIGQRDPKDVIYVAATICQGLDGVWTNDNDFTEQEKIPIFTTKDIIGLKY